ncbi:neural proliferation differentiation and control protein 1-like [Tropilaelaps mercedesae]|uniref:Neural proliferation differentiation and control protein 1-like n=1 Tax=Tropilaelaps mercedesae TaxID=418985 RepID=A0A1V9XEB0_9ACAR|nr:neural proliferation differentiation and control protein 1-like [Tropilaelaps mercedesae]
MLHVASVSNLTFHSVSVWCLFADFNDPADDPNSPDYRITAEHFPRYLLPDRDEKPSAVPDADGGNDVGEGIQDDNDAERVPRPQPLQRAKEEVIIRAEDFADIQFIAVVAGCSTIAAFLIVSTGYCVYRVHQNQRMAQDVDYPAYGVTGPVKNALTSPPTDRKLAQSAQMYHFQHQKQQMIAVEKNQQAVLPSLANRRGSRSEGESDDEDKDYTVYECPGLAPGGQMEVRNPLFHERKTSK